MQNPTIITCAVTGGADSTDKSPYVPITPQQIADQAIDAAKAGAAIVHLHVRNVETGKPSVDYDLYAEAVDKVRSSSVDVAINLTSGPGCFYEPDGFVLKPAIYPEMTPEDRVSHIVKLKPELCSLDIGSFNFGDFVAVNMESHLAVMAKLIAKAGTVPELEVFDLGQVRQARYLIEKGVLQRPGYFQFCLGIPWGAPAQPEAISLMKSLLPPEAHWSAFGISRDEFTIAAETVMAGGNVRVGLEDNLYISHGKLAENNAVLVEEAAKIISDKGSRIATAAEARKILGLTKH